MSGYGPTYDFSPPNWTYVICRVRIAYDGAGNGTIKCAPNWFKLDTSTKNEMYQSFRFSKKEPPDYITFLPETQLKPGETISGDLVFEIIEGEKPLRVEYSAPEDPGYVKNPNFMTN